jgi:hypothetical protein
MRTTASAPRESTNFWQIFIAPLFLMVEVFAWLGWKRELLRRAEDLATG